MRFVLAAGPSRSSTVRYGTTVGSEVKGLVGSEMAELLAMGLRMTLHLHHGFIIVSIDMINAYNEIKRAVVLDAHNRHTYLRRMVPYWRAKLSPTSRLWAGRDSLEHHEGLVQGSSISSLGFSFTID